MTSTSEIIARMRAVAPEGLCLTAGQLSELRALTGQLAAAEPGAMAEYRRFLAIRERQLVLPEGAVADRLEHATIVVTGGTGCIGSALMSELAACRPRQLASITRGLLKPWPRQPGVQYLHADVRDRAALDRLLGAIRPDVIFHVAAQRSPALAESNVCRTVTTNVLGTRNVLQAALATGVPQVVIASTGKALRPYSPEVYTASKRAAEWIASGVAREGRMLVSACRFTHVVDNSIIHERLRDWTACGKTIRLHAPDIAFYAQSARESAQLLLVALLGAEPGELRVHAITDLQWPLRLLDIALGTRQEAGSRAPVYFSGYDPGYEEAPYPGLYDPMTGGDVSPLLNMLEEAERVPSPCVMTDSFRTAWAQEDDARHVLGTLEGACASASGNHELARQRLDALSWALLDASLAAARPQALSRSASLLARHAPAMSVTHQRVAAAVQRSSMLARQAARR